MFNKSIMMVAIFLVALLAVSAVSAENQTQELTDLNASISFPDEVAHSETLNDNSHDLKIDAPDDYDGNVSVYVDEEAIRENVTGNSIGIYPFEYSLGNHTLRVNFQQTSVYKELNLTKNFTIHETLIKIGSEYNYAYASVKTASDVTGYVTVFVNGSQVKKTNLEDIQRASGYSTQILNLNPGYYNVTVVYSGDNHYKRAERSKVVYIGYSMFFSNTEFYYFGDKEFGISLPHDIKNKKIDVLIDGKNYSSKYNDEYEYFSVDLGDLSIGKHSVSVSYNGDSVYPKQTKNETIIIYSMIDCDMKQIYGENSSVSLKLPGNENGNLSVYLSKNEIDSENPADLYAFAPLINGVANITISGLDSLEYYIFAHYDGPTHVDDLKGFFRVIPQVTVPSQAYFGEKVTVSVAGNENAVGIMEGFIEDEDHEESSFSFDVGRGKGNYTFGSLPIGKNRISLEYYADGSLWSSYSFYVTVKRNTPVLSQNNDVNMYYSDGSAFSVKVKDGLGRYGSDNLVKFKIGSKTYKAYTDSKGIAKLKITEKPGKYKITATYAGVSVSNKIVVKKILSLNSVKVKKSAKKLVLTAKLAKKLKGKKITFKFNGKKYTANTNKKGIAKVTVKSSVLKKLKVGKKITYQAAYLKDSVKKTVKVIK